MTTNKKPCNLVTTGLAIQIVTQSPSQRIYTKHLSCIFIFIIYVTRCAKNPLQGLYQREKLLKIKMTSNLKAKDNLLEQSRNKLEKNNSTKEGEFIYSEQSQSESEDKMFKVMLKIYNSLNFPFVFEEMKNLNERHGSISRKYTSYNIPHPTPNIKLLFTRFYHTFFTMRENIAQYIHVEYNLIFK